MPDFYLSGFKWNCQPDLVPKKRTIWSNTVLLATLSTVQNYASRYWWQSLHEAMDPCNKPLCPRSCNSNGDLTKHVQVCTPTVYSVGIMTVMQCPVLDPHGSDTVSTEVTTARMKTWKTNPDFVLTTRRQLTHSNKNCKSMQQVVACYIGLSATLTMYSQSLHTAVRCRIYRLRDNCQKSANSLAHFSDDEMCSGSSS